MPAQHILKLKPMVGYKSEFPVTPSTQSLVPKHSDPDFQQVLVHESKSPTLHLGREEWCSVLILFFVNLINYMDRLTIAGILVKIQNDFSIGDAHGGALQTAFVFSYMIFAPMFGFLGDRYSRRYCMAGGVAVWSLFTLIGSFMTNYNSFLFCRAMVGIGEASYSTIAPTIISDMFVKELRSKMLAVFYFAIPVGSGLGYMIGAGTTVIAGGNWRWGLRVTPVLGVFAVLLIIFILRDPLRGQSEGRCELEPTNYYEDICGLCKNRSFIYSTLAFTCVTFCTGALSWWGPKYLEVGLKSLGEGDLPISVKNVAFVFGAVTMMSGIVGVPLGSFLSTTLSRTYKRADAYICATGLFVSSVFIFLGILYVRSNIYLAFLALFIGEVALNLNWSIVADILLYVVIPTRRSTAEAVQILFSHAFGDAGSPYLIGLISDSLRSKLDRHSICGSSLVSNTSVATCDITINYYSMQYSMFSNNIVQVLGGFFFLVTAAYIIKDKYNCRQIISEARASSPSSPFHCPSSVTSLLTSKSRCNGLGCIEGGDIFEDDDDDEPPQLRLIANKSTSRRRTRSKGEFNGVVSTA